MRRIIVVGPSGSGKRTLARRLAQLLELTHIELDALHWEPNWTSTPPDRMREKVVAAMNGAPQGWVICGNYRGVVSDAIRPRADTLIWLDYPMSTVAWRVLRRTLMRCWRREILWGGCRENIWMQLCTKDSIFLWVINTWRIRRRDYPKQLRSDPSLRHMRIIRHRSPRETDAWLAKLASPTQMEVSSSSMA